MEKEKSLLKILVLRQWDALLQLQQAHAGGLANAQLHGWVLRVASGTALYDGVFYVVFHMVSSLDLLTAVVEVSLGRCKTGG